MTFARNVVTATSRMIERISRSKIIIRFIIRRTRVRRRQNRSRGRGDGQPAPAAQRPYRRRAARTSRLNGEKVIES
jgi:hypothetical protein